MYDKKYYITHTSHYLTRNLSAIPSFAWIKNNLAVRAKESILDAGCGTGYLLDYITPPSSRGVGIDISGDAIKTARKSFPRLIFRTGELTRLPFPENSFDKIFCFNVIEHIENQDKAMKELVRVLRKGGTLIIGTNIRNSLSWTLFKLFLGGDPTHVHEFSADEFVKFTGKYLKLTDRTLSSCIARFPPPINAIFHKILKGDILVKAVKA